MHRYNIILTKYMWPVVLCLFDLHNILDQLSLDLGNVFLEICHTLAMIWMCGLFWALNGS
jgi:hypothetical protein